MCSICVTKADHSMLCLVERVDINAIGSSLNFLIYNRTLWSRRVYHLFDLLSVICINSTMRLLMTRLQTLLCKSSRMNMGLILQYVCSKSCHWFDMKTFWRSQACVINEIEDIAKIEYIRKGLEELPVGIHHLPPAACNSRMAELEMGVWSDARIHLCDQSFLCMGKRCKPLSLTITRITLWLTPPCTPLSSQRKSDQNMVSLFLARSRSPTRIWRLV
jgi:hypothetical protein